MSDKVNDLQQVDIKRIRQHIQEGQALTPMITELLDLVEGSTLLEDAEESRRSSMISDSLVELDPDNDADNILPKDY